VPTPGMSKPAKSGQSVHATSVIVYIYMYKVADRPKHDHDKLVYNFILPWFRWPASLDGQAMQYHLER